MAFFTSAIGVLQTLVIALGAGLGVWGVINLLEGYGNDNRATCSWLKRLCADPIRFYESLRFYLTRKLDFLSAN